MRIALAHDFLIRWGGAEQVLFDLHKIFPEAPIFTLFYDKNFIKRFFPDAQIKVSSLQKKYQRRKKHQSLAPFMPPAVEELDFSNYDLVISSSSGFIKGIIVSSKTKHICYLHTPTRWAWQDYKHKTHNIKHITWRKKHRIFLKKLYIHFYRLWDFEATQRPDMLIANSRYTAQRIQKYYRRKAQVIYPGTEISNFKLPACANRRIRNKYQIPNTPYFIIVSRLSPYKHLNWAIEAFSSLSYNLLIVGEGPEEESLKLKIKNLKLTNKIFLRPFIEDKRELLDLIRDSIGLMHLAEEDFGLVMVEALKLGKPVIAYNRGGAREVITPGVNGELFEIKNQEPSAYRQTNRIRNCGYGLEDLKKKLINVAENRDKYKVSKIKKTAKDFNFEKFKNEIKKIIKL